MFSPHPSPLPKERGQYVIFLELISLAKLNQFPLFEGEVVVKFCSNFNFILT